MAPLRTLLVALMLPLASAWWCTGHMLTAAIARRHMCKSAIAQSDELIGLLANEFPATPDFTQAACWPDDIKKMDIGMYSNWHFINLPFVRGPLTNGIPAPAGGPGQVVWAMEQCNHTLSSNVSRPTARAEMLRFLIHFVGDAHQPMHDITMFNDERFPAPDGDQGGNLFLIQGQNQTRLHMFWDAGGEQWLEDAPRPLSKASYSWLYSEVDRIQAAYPIASESQRLQVPAFMGWSSETYTLASKVAYPPKYNTTLTADFVSRAQQVSEEQVAVGGYRLAQILNSIFGCDSSFPKVSFPKVKLGLKQK